jgi:LysR family glycine cleavage system transcriptional activator
MPNLAAFYSEFPGIELLVRSETAQPSSAWMAQEGIDVVIHYGHQRIADLVELASLQEWTFPVCSPAYLDRLSAISREQPSVVLMHDDDAWRQGEPPRAEWQEWLEHAGSTWSFLTAGERHFNQAQLAYQAAAYGQGMAMARAISVNALLRQNKLVRAIDAQPAASASYRVLARCEHSQESPASRFASWLSRALVATQRDTLRLFEEMPAGGVVEKL